MRGRVFVLHRYYNLAKGAGKGFRVGVVLLFSLLLICVLQACKQNKAKARKETKQDTIKEQTKHTPQQPQHGNPSQHP